MLLSTSLTGSRVFLLLLLGCVLATPPLDASDEAIPYSTAGARRSSMSSPSEPAFQKGERVYGEFTVECDRALILIGRPTEEYPKPRDIFEIRPQNPEHWVSYLGQTLPMTVKVLGPGKVMPGHYPIPLRYPALPLTWGESDTVVNPTYWDLAHMPDGETVILRGHALPNGSGIRTANGDFHFEGTFPKYFASVGSENYSLNQERSVLPEDYLQMAFQKGPGGRLLLPRRPTTYLLEPGPERIAIHQSQREEVKAALLSLEAAATQNKYSEFRDQYAQLVEGKTELRVEEAEKLDALVDALPPDQRPLVGIEEDLCLQFKNRYGRLISAMTKNELRKFAQTFSDNAFEKPLPATTVSATPLFEILEQAGFSTAEIHSLAKRTIETRPALVEVRALTDSLYLQAAQRFMDVDASVKALGHPLTVAGLSTIQSFVFQRVERRSVEPDAEAKLYNALATLREGIQAEASLLNPNQELQQNIRASVPGFRQLQAELSQQREKHEGSLWELELLLAHMENRKPNTEWEPSP